MTEKEKMLAGMVYSAVDEQLLDELNAVKGKLTVEYAFIIFHN